MGHCVIMGRKTFESIGKDLPGRTMIVLTQGHQRSFKNVLMASSREDGLRLAEERNETELFVIGGSQVYKLFLPLSTKMYLSRIDYTGKADVYFPKFHEKEWDLKEYKYYKAKENTPSWSFEILEKNSGHTGRHQTGHCASDKGAHSE